jgi:hypothetical protein
VGSARNADGVGRVYTVTVSGTQAKDEGLTPMGADYDKREIEGAVFPACYLEPEKETAQAGEQGADEMEKPGDKNRGLPAMAIINAAEPFFEAAFLDLGIDLGERGIGILFHLLEFDFCPGNHAAFNDDLPLAERDALQHIITHLE